MFNAEQADELAWGWVQELLTSPGALERGLWKHKAQRDRESAPVVARLKVVHDLLADNRDQLQVALDLCLRRIITPELLLDTRTRLERLSLDWKGNTLTLWRNWKWVR